MPGEKETKVGSSAHLAASTTKTTSTIVPSSSSSITVKSPAGNTTSTTTTTCHNTSKSFLQTAPTATPNTNTASTPTPGLIPGPPGKVAPIVNVNVNPSNRLSQVSLKKSEDGSLSVSIVDGKQTDHRNDTDEEEDGSKMELELTFAGIDNETVELELEEDDNNMDSNGKGPSGSPGGESGGGRIIIPGDRRLSPEGGVGPSVVRGGPGSVTSPVSRAGSVTAGLESVTGPTGSVGGVVGGTTAETMDEEEDEDVEGGKTAECTEVIVPIQTLAEKCLFYVTAFFILLAIFR